MNGILARPRILDLLATYNGEPWLDEQLASLLAQQNVDVDLLIGDDVSIDGTRDRLAAWCAQRPAARVVNWNKGSGSAGANFRRLYLEADLWGYDYVALSDQDDVWLPHKLERAVASLLGSGAHCYSCAVQAFWPDGRSAVLPQAPTLRPADFLFEGGGQGCTFVIRAAAFGRIQQFCRAHPIEANGLHYHDWLIYILARAWDLAWFFDPQPMLRYRQHGGNEIGSRGGMGAVKRRLAMIKNGWYREQVRLASAVYYKAGGENPRALAIAASVQPGRSLRQRALLVLRVARDGRRRFIDRAVLVGAVVLGWL